MKDPQRDEEVDLEHYIQIQEALIRNQSVKSMKQSPKQQQKNRLSQSSDDDPAFEEDNPQFK